MQRNRVLIMCVFGAVEVALAGCSRKTVVHEPVVVQPAPAQVVVKETQTPIVVQSETMPAPRVEQPGPPPTSSDVWVAGHWEKSDAGWVWKSGHWERR